MTKFSLMIQIALASPVILSAGSSKANDRNGAVDCNDYFTRNECEEDSSECQWNERFQSCVELEEESWPSSTGSVRCQGMEDDPLCDRSSQ